MRKLKLLSASIFAAAILFAATISAQAQSSAPSSDALAASKDLVEVTGVLKQFEGMVPVLVNQINQGLAATDPAYLTDNKQKEALADASKVALVEGDKLKNELIKDIIQLYAQRFTTDQMKEITAFMKSKAGQKFVQEAPSVLSDSMRLGQYWNGEITNKLTNIMKEELGKRGVK